MSDYSRGYGRGYSAGLRHAWPDYMPPITPEHPLIFDLIVAAKDLRSAAEGVCQTLLENDEFVLALSPNVDSLDKALLAIRNHIDATMKSGIYAEENVERALHECAPGSDAAPMITAEELGELLAPLLREAMAGHLKNLKREVRFAEAFRKRKEKEAARAAPRDVEDEAQSVEGGSAKS